MGANSQKKDPSKKEDSDVQTINESSSASTTSSDHELNSIYDQNRNLNLNETDLIEKQQDTLGLDSLKITNSITDNKIDTDCNREPLNSSPISTLTNSDADSSFPATGASGCSSASTNPTTCSIRQMSQNSLSNENLNENSHLRFSDGHKRSRSQDSYHDTQIDAQIIDDDDDTDNNNDEINAINNNGNNVTFQQDPGKFNEHELAQFAKINSTPIDIDDTNHQIEDSVVIKMLQDGQENKVHIDKNAIINYDSDERSLIRQLGRRVSVIPQLLARRLSKASFGHAGNGPARPRRFSMQNGAFSNLPETQPTTVAGVGGTITTVTRSTRKTAPLPRLVAKNGTVNLFLDNIDRRQYVRDLFTTMIDIKWRYNLMAAAFGFVFSWIFFACIWYIVLYVHDDLVHENDPTWSPCIVNVYSFPAALLFSIETQSTLGFGSRIISVECPGAIVIFCIQLIFGVVVECLIVGMVFAKLSRPAKRSQTIMYSKYAVVCLREGRMCLMFRVGDVRSKSHIIGATIRASLVSQKITEEGEIMPFYHHQLDVKIDDSNNSLLLIWPLTIVHLIDENSPFYRLDAEHLANFKFEIITVLEGTVESTGQSIQVRSSYLPSEVKWGYRFEPIVSTHGYGRYAQTIIDYNKFNRVIEVDTPRSSAIDYYSNKQNNSGRDSIREEWS